MTTKVLNKCNPETGHFICNRCSGEVTVGLVIKHKVFCNKCAGILTGTRTEEGKLKMYEHHCPRCKQTWHDHDFESRCPECKSKDNVTRYVD